MMPSPLVEVVIATHRPDRPVERAVASVLDGTTATRALVVAHQLDPAALAARLAAFGSRVQVLPCPDRTASPAAPLNVGLAAATAPWVTCLGSDDYCEPGSGPAWAAYLARRPVDALILPLWSAHTGRTDIPPVRPGRRRDLHVVRDRLFYRTSPAFLVRRALLATHGIAMTNGLATGEDLAYSAHVFACAQRVDLAPPTFPRYRQTADGPAPVTARRFSLPQLLAPAIHLRQAAWVTELEVEVRAALAVRVVRKTLLPALAAAPAARATELAAAQAELAAWERWAPRLGWALSRSEADLWVAARQAREAAQVQVAARRWRAAARWAAVVPARPAGWWGREAAWRYAWARRPGRGQRWAGDAR